MNQWLLEVSILVELLGEGALLRVLFLVSRLNGREVDYLLVLAVEVFSVGRAGRTGSFATVIPVGGQYSVLVDAGDLLLSVRMTALYVGRNRSPTGMRHGSRI